MIKDLIGALWRRAPARWKGWAIRFTQPRFTVTAGAIVSNDKGQVLLLKHRFRPGSGWGMPGGFLERGEQPADALRRELREEIGLEVSDVQLFETRTFKKARQVEIIFRCRAAGKTEQLNFEIKKAAWFSPDDLPKELPRDQARLIKLAFKDGAQTPD